MFAKDNKEEIGEGVRDQEGGGFAGVSDNRACEK